MEFGLATRQEADAAVVAVAGEVDAFTAPQLRAALFGAVEDGSHTVIVDLTTTEFLDSSALGTLVGVNKQLLPGQRLAIVCPEPRLRRLFNLSRLDEVLSMFDSVPAALTGAPTG